MSVAASGVMVAVDIAFPSQHLFESLTGTLRQIDFTTVVMDGMLAFLLFAGALHVDLGKLRSRAVPVALLAFVGTVISTGIVGGGHMVGRRAVRASRSRSLGAGLRRADQPDRSGRRPQHAEDTSPSRRNWRSSFRASRCSTTASASCCSRSCCASRPAIAPMRPAHGRSSMLLLVEAGGGVLLGLVTGYVAYWGMQLIDDYPSRCSSRWRWSPAPMRSRSGCTSAARWRWWQPAF